MHTSNTMESWQPDKFLSIIDGRPRYNLGHLTPTFEVSLTQVYKQVQAQLDLVNSTIKLGGPRNE